MFILGLCADKGLLDLFLQDARRLPAGLQIEILNPALALESAVSLVKYYRHSSTVVLLMADASDYSDGKINLLVQESEAAFTYYRSCGDRWFKYLKNRIKPVSVDYRVTEFWFMLGSIYTAIVAHLHREDKVMTQPGLVVSDNQIAGVFGEELLETLRDPQVLAVYVRFNSTQTITHKTINQTHGCVIVNGNIEVTRLTANGAELLGRITINHQPLNVLVSECLRTLILSRIDSTQFFIGGLSVAEIDYVSSVPLLDATQEKDDVRNTQE